MTFLFRNLDGFFMRRSWGFRHESACSKYRYLVGYTINGVYRIQILMSGAPEKQWGAFDVARVSITHAD